MTKTTAFITAALVTQVESRNDNVWAARLVVIGALLLIIMSSPAPVCAQTASQQFVASGGRCLSVRDDNPAANGSEIILQDCTASPSQQWSVHADGTIHGLGGKCLHVGSKTAVARRRVGIGGRIRRERIGFVADIRTSERRPVGPALSTVRIRPGGLPSTAAPSLVSLESALMGT